MKNIFMITVRMNNFRLKNYEPYKTYKVYKNVMDVLLYVLMPYMVKITWRLIYADGN